MGLEVYSDDPRGLLNFIKSRIDAGEIEAWEYDDDANSFFHSPNQYRTVGFLATHVMEERLALDFRPLPHGPKKPDYKGSYYGHFLEMLINHCAQHLEKIVYRP